MHATFEQGLLRESVY